MVPLLAIHPTQRAMRSGTCGMAGLKSFFLPLANRFMFIAVVDALIPHTHTHSFNSCTGTSSFSSSFFQMRRWQLFSN